MAQTDRSNKRPRFQPVVSFRFDIESNLHAAVFDMTVDTLARYPDSRLAKLVESYPEHVEKKVNFFVDRDPKSFHWIREIYRDGDLKKHIPDMSKEMLEKDLEFYMLPSLQELGLDAFVDQRDAEQTGEFSSKNAAGRSLLDQILYEIEESGLNDMFPWRINIYHKFEEDKLDPVRRVFISVPEGLDSLPYVQQRGHEKLHETLTTPHEHFCHVVPGERLLLKHRHTEVRFALTQATDSLLAVLKSEANKRGLQVWFEAFPFIDATGHKSWVKQLAMDYNV